MSYSTGISISLQYASDLCWVTLVAPSLWGTEPSSISFSLSTKLQQPMSALCCERTSALRFNTSLRESSSLSDILLFRCSISGRTSLFAANSVSVGLSAKLEQLDSPSCVSGFIENIFKKTSIRSFFCWLRPAQSWHCVQFVVLWAFLVRCRSGLIDLFHSSREASCRCLCHPHSSGFGIDHRLPFDARLPSSASAHLLWVKLSSPWSPT